MLTNGESPSNDYTTRQDAMNRQYEKGWKDAPAEFKERAARAGIEAEPQRSNGMALPFNENYHNTAYYPDMSAALDTQVDSLVEKYGFQHEKMIHEIVRDLR